MEIKLPNPSLLCNLSKNFEKDLSSKMRSSSQPQISKSRCATYCPKNLEQRCHV
ncbi:hypothetical protein Scep_023752 [Stephania cephalantha]|uniref:Uncharacterized protein n=1 Tax=Stephania cephalantha TaxID=152367 RepID=A0AAP0F0Q0_9MAGN